jgi:hypothetical protein
VFLELSKSLEEPAGRKKRRKKRTDQAEPAEEQP